MPVVKVLVIDDEKMIRWSMEQTLKAAGYEVFTAGSAAEGMQMFRQEIPEVIFLDIRLPDEDGLQFLKKIREEENGKETAVIVMTAYGEIRSAVEAMRLGAYDYLKKPFDFDELEVIVGKALETTRLRQEVVELRWERKKPYGLENIIGQSEKMEQVLSLVERIAQSDATTVLIQGESGTGKDLIARAIHYQSRRADKPFMDISCTAMPETLFESELFGYEKGAFTDARAMKKGLLELADGGTVFLDEVGDVPLVSQAKLLKIIENKTFKRLGGTVDKHVDVRFIVATNRELEQAVKEKKFRDDLYYRLKVIPIYLSPLREKREDIPLLLHYFMEKYNRECRKNFRRVSEEALHFLMHYHWPGNVRELKNLVERVMILEKGDEIRLEYLPPEMTVKGQTHLMAQALHIIPPGGISLEEVERDLVCQALEVAQGNQTKAAQLLGIGRDALRYRMEKFGLR